MTDFNLQAQFKPTGDQPTAIAQLTAGLKEGLQHQTLLGVTGSGKSVTADTKVILSHQGQTLSIPIGQLDGLFPEMLPQGVEATQIATLGDELLTNAMNPNSGASTIRPVTEVTRHSYTGELYKVTAANGATNSFTDSHNVYVLRQGTLQLVQSAEIRIGDYLPTAQALPAINDHGMSKLDVRNWLPAEDFYVDVAEPARVATLGATVALQKAYGNERLRYDDYQRLDTSSEQAAHDRISSRSRRAAIPILINLTPDFLKLLGIYIAEGHATKNYVTLSTGDMSMVNDLDRGVQEIGLKLVKRLKKYDYQVNGTCFAKLLKALCGRDSYSKQLPAFWPNLNNAQLGLLLSGLYAGDGWVETNSVCLATASYELATSLQTALLRFGIHGSLHSKKVIYRNTSRKNYIVRVCGQQDLQSFADSISLGLVRKDELLARMLSMATLENTNVNVMPLPIQKIKTLMAQSGLFQKDVAIAMGVSRSLVSMYLSGLRVPARFRVRNLYFFFANISTAATDRQYWETLAGLSGLFWSPVTDITLKPADNIVVYDLSVPGDQTFLAGSYYVHNTFTAANLIQNVQKPTLILSHNKTLAAQLYGEFKHFFPDNAVHYFVSYFDYYQPEAYIARSDTFIEKDSQINEEIDRLRHAATDALLSRKDVIIVASVSCIYGIGSKEDYGGMSLEVSRGENRKRDKLLRHLTDMQYQRNDIDFHRGTFRVRGDVVDIFPSGEELAYRLDFFGDEIERITQIDQLTGEILKTLDHLRVFPSSHYVTPQDKLKVALGKIQDELQQRLAQFKMEGKLLEAQRLEQRTRYDLEMLEETGFVKGIENYSRYLTNREPGEQPATLMDYFPDDYLLLIDESHMTLPQVRGMYNGDRARKEVLVEHGFRLPSALDNRPLTFTEFERHVNKAVYISATPAEYELSRSPAPAQQVIRPTGLLDPPIEIRPVEGQVDDLIAEIRATTAKQQRVLVTTLTKRMSEDLTDYLKEINIKVAYLHSDVDTLDRTDILRDLRLGVYDVLIGINLLREGLDLPEVSLVAILDADKEGFLRSEQALVQTVGRAARHVEGRVIMYADRVTRSMQATIDETTRRRKIQEAHNTEHGITPTGINRAVEDGMNTEAQLDAKKPKLNLNKIPKDEYKGLIKDLSGQMELAAQNLQFEQAAELRDMIDQIKAKQ